MILGYFLAGFIIFLYGSNLVDTMVVCVFAIFSAMGLYIFGPNPFLFGMIFSTGWWRPSARQAFVTLGTRVIVTF